MRFSKQEYWNGLPFPSPGDLPNPGIEPGSPVLQVDFLPSEPPGKQLKACICLFLFSVQFSCSVVSDSLRPHGLQPTRLLRPWDFPGKSTEVGCHFLIQGIFPTQGLNLGLLYCRQILHHYATWVACGERLLLTHEKMPGFLASGGEEFNPGPETRLDCSELLCNKVLLKYKGDRESF